LRCGSSDEFGSQLFREGVKTIESRDVLVLVKKMLTNARKIHILLGEVR
jgi:hypothetical protein